MVVPNWDDPPSIYQMSSRILGIWTRCQAFEAVVCRSTTHKAFGRILSLWDGLQRFSYGCKSQGYSRWFKITFWSPSWRSRLNLWNGRNKSQRLASVCNPNQCLQSRRTTILKTPPKWAPISSNVGLYFGYGPFPVTVTIRIITFLVGNPYKYKPLFATLTG